MSLYWETADAEEAELATAHAGGGTAAAIALWTPRANATKESNLFSQSTLDAAATIRVRPVQVCPVQGVAYKFAEHKSAARKSVATSQPRTSPPELTTNSTTFRTCTRVLNPPTRMWGELTALIVRYSVLPIHLLSGYKAAQSAAEPQKPIQDKRPKYKIDDGVREKQSSSPPRASPPRTSSHPILSK